MLRKRTLGNKKKSTYTVYSNCNGGSVYFNNNLVGIISSGKLIVELSGADSYTVKIEGGVPSTSTSTSESTDSGSDTSNEYSPSGELRGGGKGQGYTTRDFGEPTGKRNAGGGGADRNRDSGNGGESDYDEGCGTGKGTRKSGGYGGGGCGSYGTGGDGTVLIRYYAYKE